MKDVSEVLRAKEQELVQVKRQVEALRIALPLLEDEEQGRGKARAAGTGEAGTSN